MGVKGRRAGSRGLSGNRWRCGRGLAAAATLGVLLLASSPSRAHRVYVYAWTDGGTVHTESYFGSKRKAANAPITVFGADGQELLAGRTDPQGRFSFPVPARQDLRIVVEAGMGHRAEYVLEAAELGSVAEPRRQAPGLLEIVGGLATIFGSLALFLYWRRRTSQKGGSKS